MSLNILVVDDSAVVRAVIVKTLRLTGLPIGQVYEAADGERGLKAMEDNWVDVVFADLNMPVMDGEEMITRIRANPVWADAPIIVVSTEGSQTRIERLRGMGAKFIHKPFTPETIRNAVVETFGAFNEQPIA